MTKLKSLLRKINEKLRVLRMNYDVSRNIPVGFAFKGKRYWVNPDKSATYHILNSTAKLSNLAELIPGSARIIFDVGANCGLFSAFADITSARKASIYCFEPSRDLVQIIHRNVSSERVSVQEVAVGDSDGQVEFFVNTESQQTNSVDKNAVELFALPNMVQSRMVNCIRLDTFAKQKGIKKIDVLKIDVQGYEDAVLRGAGDLISIVEVLFIESTWMEINSITKILPFALKYGFTHLSVVNPVHMGADIALSRHRLNSSLVKIDFEISKELLDVKE